MKRLTLVLSDGEHHGAREPDTGSEASSVLCVTCRKSLNLLEPLIPHLNHMMNPLEWSEAAQPVCSGRHTWRETEETANRSSQSPPGVQGLRCCTATGGGSDSIPGWGTKIPHAMRGGQNKIKI